jgi:hypothetical protein
MKNRIFASALLLAPLSAYGAPPQETQPLPVAVADVFKCPKNPSVLSCTSKGAIIWNPEIYGDKDIPSAQATFVTIAYPPKSQTVETLAVDKNGKVLFDKAGNYIVTKTETSSEINITAVFAEPYPGGSCSYNFYYNIPSIALSQNPEAPKVVAEMREAAAKLKENPDLFYTFKRMLGRPSCFKLNEPLS